MGAIFTKINVGESATPHYTWKANAGGPCVNERFAKFAALLSIGIFHIISVSYRRESGGHLPSRGILIMGDFAQTSALRLCISIAAATLCEMILN